MRPGTKRSTLLLGLIVSSIGCDHASKGLAISALSEQGFSLAGDAIRLELAWNTGGFLSLGSRLPEPLRELVFLVAIPLLLLALCSHFLRSGIPSTPLLVGLGLAAGGGLANWLDRVMHAGVVTDFVMLGLGSFRTGVFNLADVAIVVGLGLILRSEFAGGTSERIQTH